MGRMALSILVGSALVALALAVSGRHEAVVVGTTNNALLFVVDNWTGRIFACAPTTCLSPDNQPAK
jgi:hypothetical protein